MLINNNFNFVAVSEWLKNHAEKSDLLKNYKIRKIDNNIEFSKFINFNKLEARKKLNILTQKKILLYGAQNPQSKRKGWDIFVETLEKLDKSKYYLLIFGNFWSQKTLDKVGIEYKSLGYVHSLEELNLVYCCSDLFVATSIQDAWPKTFAEAMSCGTPVVCFKNTSISEIVSHKSNGYVVNNFSSNELKQGIDWIFDDDNIWMITSNLTEQEFEWNYKGAIQSIKTFTLLEPKEEIVEISQKNLRFFFDFLNFRACARPYNSL